MSDTTNHDSDSPTRDRDRRQPELLMPRAALARSAAQLSKKYEGVFSPQTVERYVFEPACTSQLFLGIPLPCYWLLALPNARHVSPGT